ncbi:MAG: NAD-dependent deacylase [Bacteroidetes bacterium]|nr:NAD-dependent deacylase [Bacteroidota bacterium]
MKHLVVLTGAGISAESGLKTFRDAGGLWEGHRVEEVATPEAFSHNPELVLRFYNERRRQLDKVEPNLAHRLLAQLEQHYRVTVITQNVDDLHERGGSNRIVHLHGELRWGCSARNRTVREYLGSRDIFPGDKAADGADLRPDIVWFGEAVPKMEEAIRETLTADLFLVVGTSLEVYPAAGLLDFAPAGIPVYIIDPGRHAERRGNQVHVISATATQGMQQLFSILVPGK